MAKSIDLKSLLIGGLVALLVLCVLGAAPRLRPSNPIGRFALVASHDSRGEVFLLDTATGQVWPRYVNGRTDAFFAPKLRTQAPAEPNKPGTR